MIQLDINNVQIIEPLVRERLEESNLGDRITDDHVRNLIGMNVKNGSAFVFVDDASNPSCVLILTLGRVSFIPEERCTANIIHVAKSVRDKDPRMALHLSNRMIDTAKSFATSRSCDVLVMATWTYRGAVDISPVLMKAGFEPQSSEYVTFLNNQNNV